MTRKLFKAALIAASVLLTREISFATVHVVWIGKCGNTFPPQTFKANVGDTVKWAWGTIRYNAENIIILNGITSLNSRPYNDPFFPYIITIPGTYSHLLLRQLYGHLLLRRP